MIEKIPNRNKNIENSYDNIKYIVNQFKWENSIFKSFSENIQKKNIFLYIIFYQKVMIIEIILKIIIKYQIFDHRMISPLIHHFSDSIMGKVNRYD